MPDIFKVEILPEVIQKDFKKIPKADIQRIMDKIRTLGSNPRPVWSKKLSSREEYRARQGVYRILYVIDDGIKIILVTKVRHQREVYR